MSTCISTYIYIYIYYMYDVCMCTTIYSNIVLVIINYVVLYNYNIAILCEICYFTNMYYDIIVIIWMKMWILNI
jgi:hypothetical protein